MDIKHKILESIRGALKELDAESEDIHIEYPAGIENGDFSTNVAMVIAKRVGKNPIEFAEQIVAELEQDRLDEIGKIEIAGPGFINFYLSRKFFTQSIEKIIGEGKNWGKNNIFSGKKVMVEYTDPNPFKALHIGHLMSNTIGESISRLVEFSGAELKRANYQGDVGPHVAKALWGLKNGYGSLGNTTELGVAYAAGSKAYDDSKNKEEINLINKAIYEKSDKELNELYDKGRKVSLDHFEKVYKKLGTKFDEGYYFFESTVWKEGIKVVKENTPKIFNESEGAIVFHGEEYDKKLHTRVFINSEGLPTYEAKEIGLIYTKQDRYPFDVSITITASEQTEYFKVVTKALEQFDIDIANKIVHIPHGMMRLPTGKMSSRTGDVVAAEDLINSVEERVSEVVKGRNLKDKENVVQYVAMAALKYSILKQTAGKDIIYDLDKSLSFEGDSGPYLQYSNTRSVSILNKAKKENVEIDTNSCPEDIMTLEKLLYRFEDIVERASKEYEPHYVAVYLTELASSFNSFYANERIVDAPEHASYKVAITRAFNLTMENGLYILGIKIPEKM